MNCNELTNDVLLDYSDGRLAGEDRDPVTRHLDDCATCRVRKDEIGWMGDAMRRTAEPPPRALLKQLDTKSILPPVPRKVRRTHWVVDAILTAAAAILLAILVGQVLFPADGGAPPQIESDIAAEQARQRNLPLPPVENKTEEKPDPEDPAPGKEIEKKDTPSEKAPAPPAPPELKAIVKGPPIEVKPSAAPPAEKKTEEDPLRGDLNGDGLVDVADAREIQRHLLSGEPIPDHADANGDGLVDVADVRDILRAEVAMR